MKEIANPSPAACVCIQILRPIIINSSFIVKLNKRFSASLVFEIFDEFGGQLDSMYCTELSASGQLESI